MVVCHCMVVSDHEVRAQVLAGAMDADGLAAVCGAGTRCGGCKGAIAALLQETSVTIEAATAAA